MHENANIAFNLKESQLAIKTILDIQPRDTGGAGAQTPDEIISDLIKKISKMVPENIIMGMDEDQL